MGAFKKYLQMFLVCARPSDRKAKAEAERGAAHRIIPTGTIIPHGINLCQQRFFPLKQHYDRICVLAMEQA
jgi:hypothetical protein